MPREAERGVHEHRMIRKVEGVDAFGEKNGYVPVFACHGSLAFRLAVEQPQIDFVAHGLEAVGVPDLEAACVAHDHDFLVDADGRLRTSGDSMMRPEASTSTSRARLFSTRRSLTWLGGRTPCTRRTDR